MLFAQYLSLVSLSCKTAHIFQDIFRRRQVWRDFCVECSFFRKKQWLVNERNGACEMNTTTPLKKSEKNETEQSKNRERPI
jgi:hypothetical protein